MKIKVVIVILAVICVGLVIAFFATKKQADDQHTADVTTIVVFSNQVVDVTKHLDELGQVNLTLSNDLTAAQQQLTLSSEQMTLLSNSLSAASATLTATRTSLAGEEELVTNLNSRIADLEAQNKALDEQAAELTNTIALLSGQIQDTKRQLATSETNRSFLQNELKKQLAQKAELERKFNNIDELRGQVKKIKDEMFVARRLQLMRNDLGSKKGSELLRQRTVYASTPPATNTPPNYNLNVEVGSDGSVKVIPPIGGTNSPGHRFLCAANLRAAAMPTYEYVCEKCGHEFEASQPMSAAPLKICPATVCIKKKWGRGRVKKQISSGAGLLFKGSGFYITDYRSDSYKQSAKKAAGDTKPPAKTEAKPAAKAEKK